MARKRGLKLRIPLTFTVMLVIVIFVGGALTLGYVYIKSTEGIDERVIQIATAGGVAVCAIFALIAILHTIGLVRIQLKCPFCREYAELDFRYQEGFAGARPVLDCEKCGTAVNALRFGVRVERERTSVCPECGHEFEGGDDPKEPSCPECGWSEGSQEK